MLPPFHSRAATGDRPQAALRATLTILLLVGCTACGGSAADGSLDLAEYVPFSSRGVDTDLIFPRPQGGASRFLVRNWPPIRSLEGDTIWVHGSWARIGFHAVAERPPRLYLEARPYAPEAAPIQVLTVSVNEVQVASLPMPPRWQEYEIELPADAVDVGWNEIGLDFAQTLRPADWEPGSDDQRTLAAEFRRIEMRGAAARPYWPERPEAVRLVHPDMAGTASDGAANAISTGDAAPGDAATPAAVGPADGVPAARGDGIVEMPADSFLEIYLVPDDGAEVRGTVEAELTGTGGSLQAVAEALTPDGATRLWSADLRPGAATASMMVDLSPWADRVVGLRLRVFGDTNGIARWSGLRLDGVDEAYAARLRPERLVAAPRSGVLGRPDVFVIILDAARGDVFDGALAAELAPNVRALAADGTTFAHAWAPSSWTGQSIPAMWSGLTPDTVGIEHWGSRLPPAVTTFPELLHAAGYHTLLWSQHNIYRQRAPLRHGFERFEEVDSTDLAQREVLPAVAELVDTERPTLAVIHLLPPHAPYEPPAPFAGSRSAWYEGEPIDALLLNRFDIDYGEDQAELRDDIRRAARAMYEENVRFADHLVGRFIADLRAAGRYDDALVIVTSDHGEAFYEHGRFLHTSMLYEEFVRVPLVIKWPRSLDDFVARIDTPVSLIDLAPTLVDGLGIDDGEATYQGLSLLPVASGAAPQERVLYAYTSGQTDPEGDPSPQYALLWNDTKLTYDADRGRTELYRLSTDPGETDNLVLQREFYAGWLTQTLQLARAHNAAHLLQLGGNQVDQLDEETIRSLRALGYLR